MHATGKSAPRLAAITLSMFVWGGASEVSADPTYHHDPGEGWDQGDIPDTDCPSGYRADYHSLFETLVYLDLLSGEAHDPGGYLEIIEIGKSTMMEESWTFGGVELDSLVAARVSLDSTAPEPVRPALLLVCGIHPNEWVASEVCLGYVDWLVKGANAAVAEALALLDRVEIWAVVQGSPGGRLWDDGGWGGQVGWGNPDHQYTKNHRANMQWSHDFDCATDWQDSPTSGKCGHDEEGALLWGSEGINVARAFSYDFPNKNDPNQYTRSEMFPASQVPGAESRRPPACAGTL